MLPHLKTILGTKLLCLSRRYLPLFAYTHAKFERVEVFLKGQARCLKRQLLKISFSHYDLNDTGIGGAKNHGLKNGSTFKVQPLHLSLPVIVQFLHGIIAVTEGGDRVCLDSLT